MQSVPITTKVVSLNYAYDDVDLIQHYVIKFVSDMRQVGDFLWVLGFPPQIKLTTIIKLKYRWNIQWHICLNNLDEKRTWCNATMVQQQDQKHHCYILQWQNCNQNVYTFFIHHWHWQQIVDDVSCERLRHLECCWFFFII